MSHDVEGTGQVSCDIHPKVKGQIIFGLVNAFSWLEKTLVIAIVCDRLIASRRRYHPIVVQVAN